MSGAMNVERILNENRQIDLNAPASLDVAYDKASGVLWVNVDGVCVVRVTNAYNVTINGAVLRRTEVPA